MLHLYNRTPIGKVATLSGWRFVRISDVHSEQLDFAEDDWNCWIFTQTKSSSLLSDYVSSAERDLNVSRETYWPRVLSLPEVQMEAVWIHSPKPGVRDRYYGLPDGQAAYPDRGFTAMARDLLPVFRPLIS